ncbi:3-hydroxyacyl-CoA dehydrogenase family protein [Paenibacillus sp. GCM10012306]|uniref:3-hydroxyacyl-CoA dehydrogenase family protein n=1 Tax=Paenibacillus sp. GCM10012306 TaxID=3317342 RepID=UPI00361DC111
MRTIGIIGAGTMGCGVAQTFAEYGYQVVLLDISREALDKAYRNIYNISRFRLFQNAGGLSVEPEDLVARIKFTIDIHDLAEADFIVENAVENVAVKKEIYKQLDDICRPEVIFAANTSCISITQLGSYTTRPEQVIGIHFMNPVPQIAAAEVIRGFLTSEKTIKSTLELLERIHKESIVIQDSPGFVSNRISHLMMNEAIFLVQEQCAEPKDIDAIFEKCYGHKMGPLATADLIGLDTVLDSLNVLYESFQDSKFRCCPLLRKMVNANKLGVKSGEGFYKYN